MYVCMFLCVHILCMYGHYFCPVGMNSCMNIYIYVCMYIYGDITIENILISGIVPRAATRAAGGFSVRYVCVYACVIVNYKYCIEYTGMYVCRSSIHVYILYYVRLRICVCMYVCMY